LGQLAAQCLGGVTVPVYQDAMAAELVLRSVVIAGDQEQVDKILSIKRQLPRLGLMVRDDPCGLRFYTAPCLKSFDEIQSTIAIDEVEVTPQPAGDGL
jgi:long-chain acyl-CoA synthetase